MSIPHERLQELLMERAASGLSPADQLELDQLLREYPEAEAGDFERTIAALELGRLIPSPLPLGLRQRILIQASAHLPARPKRSPLTAWAGWAVAAAACLALLWVWPKPVADPQQQLSAANGTRHISWTATPDKAATGATGEVVWNGQLQTGYMRFSGLAANGPEQPVYQLWIFDAARDERYPVDGGVFTIAPGQQSVTVPIRATLRVNQPTLFAVTVEQSGGAVVSKRERIVVVAKVT